MAGNPTCDAATSIRTSARPLVISTTRDAKSFATVFVIVLSVISSPIFLSVNPADILAVTEGRINTISYRTAVPLVEEKSSPSSHHTLSSSGVSPTSSSTPTSVTPSTLSQDGSDFTAQAALQLPIVRQTNNIVDTRGMYDIGFLTTTAGVIASIEMVFPPGTIASNSLIEFSGIGPGLLTRPTLNSLVYTVFNPVNVPANTPIRFEIGFFNNPTGPTSTATAQITTKNTVGTAIDGPTNSHPYTIKQIGTTDIADSAVTAPKVANDAITPEKVASSFAYERELADGESGWDPGTPGQLSFIVTDSLVSDQSRIVINLDSVTQSPRPVCSVTNIFSQSFEVTCVVSLDNGVVLKYAVFTPAAP